MDKYSNSTNADVSPLPSAQHCLPSSLISAKTKQLGLDLFQHDFDKRPTTQSLIKTIENILWDPHHDARWSSLQKSKICLDFETIPFLSVEQTLLADYLDNVLPS